MNYQQDKLALRRLLLSKRRSLPPEIWQENSWQLCHCLESWSHFQKAKTILSYFSFRQEPDLSFLFRKYQDKTWGFPRCVEKSLIWHSCKPGETLVKGAYNIPEPVSNAPMLSASSVDLILVPAVACDRQGYRLGYGAGYYDRMLSKEEWKNKITIGIIFDFAYLPEIPTDAWDQKLDYIGTNHTIVTVKYDGDKPAPLPKLRS